MGKTWKMTGDRNSDCSILEKEVRIEYQEIIMRRSPRYPEKYWGNRVRVGSMRLYGA